MKIISLILVLGSVSSGQIPLTGVPAPAAAESDALGEKPSAVSLGPCSTPRTAASTWLDNLQEETFDLALASQCAAPVQDVSQEETRVRMLQLKQIFDARGIFIRIDQLSDDPDYREQNTGRRVAYLSQLFRQAYLTKQNDRWVVAAATLERVPRLHRETFPIDLNRILSGLPKWTRQPVFGISAWQIGGLGFLFMLGWMCRLIISWIVAAQLRRMMAKLQISWGEDLMSSASLPLGNLVLAAVLGLGVPSLMFGVKLAAILMVAIRTLAAISVVMLVYRTIDLLGAYLLAKAADTDTKLDDQLIPILTRSLKTVTVVIGAIFVLQNLDIDVASLLAGLGLGGLAFALAAKDVVSHIFGSVMIFLDKPFQIGDWIVAAGVEGTVAEVGLRSTRIRTFYNSEVTVPNGKFTDAIVDNYGRREFRRCSIKLGLTYDTSPIQIEAFCDGLRAIIKAHPATRKDYYEVHFCGYADSALEIMVYFFFQVETWSEELRARHEMFLDFLRLAEDLNVQFAFPTRTLHLDSQAQPLPSATKTIPTKESLSETVDGFGPNGQRTITPGQRVHPGFYAEP